MNRAVRAATIAVAIGGLVAGMWMAWKHPAAAQGYGTGGSTLRIDPATLTVLQGATASARVTVSLASGRTGETGLQATDVPDGVAIRFDPASGNPPFTSTMTVRAAPRMKPGAYTVKLQATGDDPSPIRPYEVTVEASGGY